MSRVWPGKGTRTHPGNCKMFLLKRHLDMREHFEKRRALLSGILLGRRIFFAESMSIVTTSGGTNVKAKWTIMVYIAADDGLANFAVESLKQLKNTASPNVVVAAQVGFAGSEGSTGRRYVFAHEGASVKSINDKMYKPVSQQPLADAEITDPKTLTDFIDWAYQYCKAERYCLILWGHGPELLYEAPARKKTDVETGNRQAKRDTHSGNDDTSESGSRPYFTPLQLKMAVASAKLTKSGKYFEVIGMDACSMSMVEFAYELRHLAMYMVASQEEVPDLSFPYDTLLKHFREPGCENDVKVFCEMGVKDYVETYRDSICNLQSGMKPAMLSALRLGEEGICTIKKPLTDLVTALQSLARQRNVGSAVLKARRKSKDFVAGLFVDLCDFCGKLSQEMKDVKGARDLQASCAAVSNAIKGRVVAANEVAENAENRECCNGLSIYFPYLKNLEKEKIDHSNLVKGAGGSQGDTVGKGVAIVNMAARGIRYEIRHEIIKDTERYYKNDKFEFSETGWHNFIRCHWSRILAENEPHQLDMRYSAVQCAINLASITEGESNGSRAMG
jgi:hypothetical protein